MEKLGNYKMVITGHLGTIGNTIYRYYSGQSNWQVIGYDLKSSQNLHEQTIYSSFISNCKDATHIVLNAHTGEQHSCLKELHELYGTSKKLCIVIGSMATSYWDEESEVQYGFNDYWKYKKLLDKETRRIQKLHTPFKVTMIRPSWVETPLANEYTGKKLTVDNVVDMIKYAIEYEDYIHFPTVELEAKE
ncbi:hypothetical protein EBU71_00105 [bacterium]|nr:hypothetical protein [Candidatus Elulimicrobium humile]